MEATSKPFLQAPLQRVPQGNLTPKDSAPPASPHPPSNDGNSCANNGTKKALGPRSLFQPKPSD